MAKTPPFRWIDLTQNINQGGSVYSLISELTDDEFSSIVKNSFSYKEVAQKIGYSSYSGDLSNIIKSRIKWLHIDTSHFKRLEQQTLEEKDIFVVNSTASQKTVRKWFMRKDDIEYRCSICGQEPFWNGKSLTLILDHINGVNNDDRLENLRWVCPNCNQQLDTTNGKNIKRKRQIETEHFCVDCGKKITHRAIRCKSCNTINLAHIHNMKFVPRIDRNTLKSLIRVMPFTEIGKMYDVCGNTIREWCDFYNLPRRVHDIKKFTDQEWLKM